VRIGGEGLTNTRVTLTFDVRPRRSTSRAVPIQHVAEDAMAEARHILRLFGWDIVTETARAEEGEPNEVA